MTQRNNLFIFELFSVGLSGSSRATYLGNFDSSPTLFSPWYEPSVSMFEFQIFGSLWCIWVVHLSC